MLNQLHTLSRAVYYYTSNFYSGTAAEANKLKRMMAYAMHSVDGLAFFGKMPVSKIPRR